MCELDECVTCFAGGTALPCFLVLVTKEEEFGRPSAAESSAANLVQNPKMMLLSEKERMVYRGLHAVASMEPGQHTQQSYAFHLQ